MEGKNPKEIFIKSYHIFSLPCLIDAKGFEVNKKWKLKDASRENQNDYQNYRYEYNYKNYFHPFFQNSFFVKDGYVKTYNYEIEADQIGTYTIVLRNNEKFELLIDELSLNIIRLANGKLLAVLNFYLENYSYEQMDDILKINQYGRRWFLPYYGLKPDWQSRKEIMEYEEISEIGCFEIPESIKVSFSSKQSYNEVAFTSDFHAIKGNPDFFPKGLKELMGINEAEYLIDDRFFVTSWYGNDSLAKILPKKSWIGEWKYLNNDDWFKYVFIDKPDFKSCADDEVSLRLIKEATDTRWSKKGTFYGITRYSFVELTSEWETLASNNASFLPVHLSTIYDKIVISALFQRAGLLYFAKELTMLAAEFHKGRNVNDGLLNLQTEYNLFVNQIFFSEITGQDQGIDLYERLQKQLNNVNEKKRLDQEIKQMFEIQNFKNSRDFQKRLAFLTAALVIPGFIVGFFGMNVFDSSLKVANKGLLALLIASIFLLSVTGYYFFKRIIIPKSEEKIFFTSEVVGFISLVIILLLLCFVLVF